MHSLFDKYFFQRATNYSKYYLWFGRDSSLKSVESSTTTNSHNRIPSKYRSPRRKFLFSPLKHPSLVSQRIKFRRAYAFPPSKDKESEIPGISTNHCEKKRVFSTTQNVKITLPAKMLLPSSITLHPILRPKDKDRFETRRELSKVRSSRFSKSRGD